MKNFPLVSILTPCYNGEKFLDNYFSDILKQDYPNCELIFMDDGSSDGTKEKISFYREQIERKGYALRYFYHDNIGLGGTIAVGIKYVKGDYVVWPDCDDRLYSNWISRKVEYLEEHLDYGVVRTNGIVVNENGEFLKDVVRKKIDPLHVNLFEDYLFGRNAWLQPISFMIRMSAFDSANPDRYIYPTRRGQDWQMLLPVLYKYPCGYIDEKLFEYVVHSGSLSSSVGETFEKKIVKQRMFCEIIENTIKHMEIPDADLYLRKIRIYYLRTYITTAFLYDRKKEAREYYSELKALNAFDWKSAVKVFGTGVIGFKKLYLKLVEK